MPLTESQRRTLARLGGESTLSAIERGRLEALRRFGNPDPEDRHAIEAVLSKKKET